jgi:hypothetical protein
MTTSRTRWAVTAGSVGLAAGLALGVTGLSSAASPSPSPSAQERHRSDRPFPDGMRPEFRRGLRGDGGLVSALTDDSITVRTPDGSKTVALNGSTTYYDGRTKTTKSAVQVGDVVHVRLVDPRASKPVAAVVVVLPAHLEGWVTKADGSTITVTDPSGFTRTVRTSGSTTYEKDGTTATASAVTVGTFVHAVGKVDADGTTLDATRVSTGRPQRHGGPDMGSDMGPDTGGPPNA